MICPYCGEELEEEVAVCAHCGRAVTSGFIEGGPFNDAARAIECPDDEEKEEVSEPEIEAAASGETGEDELDAALLEEGSDAVSIEDGESVSSDGNADEARGGSEAEDAVGFEGNRPSLLRKVEAANVPSIDLSWAKESLSAVRERQEKLQLLGEAKNELENERASLKRLEMELERRLDVESRYSEIAAESTEAIEEARNLEAQLNGELSDLLSSQRQEQSKLDKLIAIQARLLAPFEARYESMRERMKDRDEKLDAVRAKRDSAAAKKEDVEQRMSSDHDRLVDLEHELDRIAAKNMSASDKLKAGNVIAGEMAAIQLALAPLRDELEEAESELSDANEQLSVLEEQLQPVADEFEEVKRDLRVQREDFDTGRKPLQDKIDAIAFDIDSKNQEISDQRAVIALKQEEYDVAQDIHEHPERIDELRQGIADQKSKIQQIEERQHVLKTEEESLRPADFKGKILVAAGAAIIILIIVLSFVL